MKVISSPDNPVIKLARKLHNKKYRDQERLFLVEGRRSVQEALVKPELVHSLFLENTLADEYVDIQGTDYYLLDAKLLKQICTTETPQGMAAILKKTDWSFRDLIAGEGLIVLLDRISDPGNMGSIIRTCWALGVEGVLLSSGCVDPFSPKVVRSTMGGILNLPVLEISDLELNLLQERGYEFIGTGMKNAQEYYNVDLTGPKILILGNEASGISLELENKCNFMAKIPMNPKIDSLNVAAACAIIVAEAWRQRNGRSS